MHFDRILRDLSSEPMFRPIHIRDINPVSGQVKRRRRICIPNQSMRTLHRRLIGELRRWTTRLPYATGGLPGCSPRRNAQRHAGHRYFYLLDLADAFGSVRTQRLLDVLARRDQGLEPTDTASFLRRYCCGYHGGLHTGLPASPDLFNLYVASLVDNELGGYCDRHGITYTRYIDDLTFSSDQPIGKRKRAKIRQIVATAGLRVNHRKCQVVDLVHAGRVVINGVGVTADGRLYLPRNILAKLRGMIHACRHGCVPFAKVAGWMGLFWHTTVGGPNREFRTLNRSERTVAIAYDNLQYLLRGPKP